MPIVTLALIVLNFAVYALEREAGGQVLCDAHGLIPAQFMSSGELGPIFTSMFLHDPGTLLHIGGNMAFLLVFGALVEGRLGHRGFLGLYLASGVFGGLLHVLVDPSATNPLVGASGAVFGVLAVAGVLRPRMLGFVIAFAGIEVWRAFTGLDPGVSFGAHIGGLLAGSVVASILRALGSEALEPA